MIESTSVEFDAWWSRVGLPPQHFCYLLYDQYGHLLYCGITVNLRDRLSAHHDSKPWINEVSRVEVERYDTREESKARESYLIKNLGPIYNSMENGTLDNAISYFGYKLEAKCPGAVAIAGDFIRAARKEKV